VAEHPVQWVAASPLWREAFDPADAAPLRRPALLRFQSDDFMDDLNALLRDRPDQLSGVVARREGFRARPTGAPRDWTPPPPPALKLYQPGHGTFYLVAASLVCRAVGMPDRAVDVGRSEKVAFALRRLAPDGTELAWTGTADPSQGKTWTPVPAAQARLVAPGEELMPLFPTAFTRDGKRRRLHLGLVPTSSRETFQGTPALSPMLPGPSDPGLATEPDPRLDEVSSRVVDRLRELKASPSSVFGAPPADPAAQAAQEARERDASQFLTLDLADFLAANVPATWAALRAGTPPHPGDFGRPLYLLLDGSRVGGPGTPTWRVAAATALAEFARISGDDPTPPSMSFNARHTDLDPDALLQQVALALKGAPAPAPAAAGGTVPKLDPGGATRYVLRCVYQRPQCVPPHPDVVSDPTEPFVIASYFDPDAPARVIRITLPADTSIAGLRKFKKSVGFMISNQLRSQMGGATDLKKALDGDVGGGPGFDLGMLCSFSIPIITICAFIILMMFVILLNLVFWWLPFLRICFPVSFKAKG
jgi:hypothetical protein